MKFVPFAGYESAEKYEVFYYNNRIAKVRIGRNFSLLALR